MRSCAEFGRALRDSFVGEHVTCPGCGSVVQVYDVEYRTEGDSVMIVRYLHSPVYHAKALTEGADDA